MESKLFKGIYKLTKEAKDGQILEKEIPVL